MLLEARLLATVNRLAGPVRGAGVLLISVFGALSVNSPLGWALFAFVVLTSIADFRVPRVALPVAFLRVVVLSVALGDQQWTLTVLTTTLITWQWQWPPRVTVPATALLLAVQVAVAGPGVLVRAVLESVLARVAYELLRRSSRRVDALRERAVEQQRAAAVALERGRREREFLALLHDTAAATFLMAAHGGDASAVAVQARRDLSALAERDNAQGAVDLGTALTAVARGSAVTVSVEPAPVPAAVALAFVRAVGELLKNVERHAGAATVELEVSRTDDGVLVVVADDGRGFVPGDVPEHRRGLRGSVVERLRAAGGEARIDSVPGRGTSVRLVWPADD
ncbi:signal transduction histidine kinase [Lentzea atacamensis]|uniref:Signal transduction histidine kinase n=1 Tax=Lentzea atacamensis TaxID=531938 RepID=A0ABX9EG24_9PSEU|nr:sensor histidine kinase [Lentzea atacamensis]RAS70124.1 signal transduction histidine kinase [Lentzea atacamensis]